MSATLYAQGNKTMKATPFLHPRAPLRSRYAVWDRGSKNRRKTAGRDFLERVGGEPGIKPTVFGKHA